MRHMHSSVIRAWMQVCVVLLGLLVSSQLAEGRCRKARPEEVPHGANQFILLAEQEVRQIRGVVSLGDEFEKNVVVEVYRHEGTDSYEAASKTLKSERLAACVTGSDGRFSFSGLKPGKYLLHLGMISKGGINEVNAVLDVTPRGSRKALRIELTLGT